MLQWYNGITAPAIWTKYHRKASFLWKSFLFLQRAPCWSRISRMGMESNRRKRRAGEQHELPVPPDPTWQMVRCSQVRIKVIDSSKHPLPRWASESQMKMYTHVCELWFTFKNQVSVYLPQISWSTMYSRQYTQVRPPSFRFRAHHRVK